MFSDLQDVQLIYTDFASFRILIYCCLLFILHTNILKEYAQRFFTTSHDQAHQSISIKVEKCPFIKNENSLAVLECCRTFLIFRYCLALNTSFHTGGLTPIESLKFTRHFRLIADCHLIPLSIWITSSDRPRHQLNIILI